MGSASVLLLHGVQSSATTWWRMAPDLTALGWRVTVTDLLGHGTRSREPAAAWTVQDLALDVAERIGRSQVDLIVGHSLGAIVGLTLAGLYPELTSGVFLEDPPGLGGQLKTTDVADDIERSVGRAHADPEGELASLIGANPDWSIRDAQHHVENRLALDMEPVTSFLRNNVWDLPALVTACPVPVHLLAASGPWTALGEPDRSELTGQLPSGRVTEVVSGHSIHRDRPALWLHDVLRFGASLGLGA